jgi:hypothetical protein
MRRPNLTKGQEIEFQRTKGIRYKGRVNTVTGDAVKIDITDDRWSGPKQTIVRLRDVIDPSTGHRFAYKHLTPGQPMPAKGETDEVPASLPQAEAEREEPSDSGPIFGKSDLDAWLSMGKDLLANVDSMIEEKKGEILLIENQMKELADQRNTALDDIKELEARKKMLSEFYKEKR